MSVCLSVAFAGLLGIVAGGIIASLIWCAVLRSEREDW